MVHGEKEPQGSEKRQESKLVLGIPKPGPALGGKRFLLHSYCSYLVAQCLVLPPCLPPEGAPHCSWSERSKMQIGTSCYPTPEPSPLPHCPGHKIQTLCRGSQSSRQDLPHPLSSQTSSPAPPPHSLLQLLGFLPYLETIPTPMAPHSGLCIYTHLYSQPQTLPPPHPCLNNFYSPSFTSWFTCHLLWEGLLESSPSRQVWVN